MTATDELRRLLDERGVEWDELVGHPVVVGTEWHDRDGCPCTALEHADDVPDGMLSVQANLTPEQAIDATLGGVPYSKPTVLSDLQAENAKLREQNRYLMKGDLLHVLTDSEVYEQQRRKREMQASIKALEADNEKLREENERFIIKLNAEHIVRQNVEIENDKLRELCHELSTLADQACHIIPSCRKCPMLGAETCDLTSAFQRMHELGVEV